MNAKEKTEIIRRKVKELGNYRVVSEKSGVNYDWLTKFSRGAIINPTIDKVAKLEEFFDIMNHSDLCPLCKQVVAHTVKHND